MNTRSGFIPLIIGGVIGYGIGVNARPNYFYPVYPLSQPYYMYPIKRPMPYYFYRNQYRK